MTSCGDLTIAADDHDHPLKTGWVSKKGTFGWNPRFAVVDRNFLYLYLSGKVCWCDSSHCSELTIIMQDAKPKRVVYLDECSVEVS